MSRALLIAGFILAANVFAVDTSAKAAEPSPQSQAAPVLPLYTTAATATGTLLEDRGAKAVLERHVPQLLAHEQIAMARSMTLKQIQSFASEILTEVTLARIDADLAKLPRK